MIKSANTQQSLQNITCTTMSEMTNREDVTNVLVSRVTENAPLRELIRVYSEAVQAAVGQMDDDGLIRAIVQAGYPDILEAFGLTMPQEAPAEPAAEPAVV
jgi:hypothetical protein